MRTALLAVVALLLSGCASAAPSAGDPAVDDAIAAADPFAAPPAPLRFAIGDYEGSLAGDATFSIAAQCFFECTAGGEEVVDLTSIVPAEAPVELVVTVQQANAQLEFVDAYAIGSGADGFGEFDGQATNFAAIVIRGDSGKVLLRIYNPGGFGFPPNTAPTASYEAQSVVRSERLVANVPAAVQMRPGEVLNLTGDAVEEAILIAPDGALTRDATAPFSLQANGTAGAYTVLMLGTDSTYVYGPGTTMAAKRVERVEGDPEPLASGSATTFTFTAQTRPLMVGLEIGSTPVPGTPVPFVTAGSTMTQFEATVTGPNGAVLIDEGQVCMPLCGFAFGGFTRGMASDYLDDRLQAGTYEVTVSYTGNGMQASAWHLVIA